MATAAIAESCLKHCRRAGVRMYTRMRHIEINDTAHTHALTHIVVSVATGQLQSLLLTIRCQIVIV